MTKAEKPELEQSPAVLVCNCEQTMQIDQARLAQALPEMRVSQVHTQLCRRQIAAFEGALGSGAALTVACTQEAPLFAEVAAEKGREDLTFVNVREQAGWCRDQQDAVPKIAALLAAARHVAKPTSATSIESDGQCLVYGTGQIALDVAERLAPRLNVTVILTDAGDAIPPSTVNVPLHLGQVRQAAGTFGNFSLTIDGFAPSLPSAKRALAFEPPRDGASTTCDLILDLSGGPALFGGSVKRDGYVKADPADAAAVAQAAFEISDLVGTFEKPLYVGYDAAICAHSRSSKIGCRNCIDNCPTGAITPDGDNISVDAALCAGCGSCTAVCPTGAISYAYPDRQDTINRISTLSSTYDTAGGHSPVLLVHDETHGAPVIAMMARFGLGLPANVIPLSVYSVFQLGHEVLTTSIAQGFDQVVILAPPDKPHDLPALESQTALTDAMLDALGHGTGRIVVLSEVDPDVIENAIYELPQHRSIGARRFAPLGGKRDIARSALVALNEAAPEPRQTIALPPDAPYGRITIDADNCTLCLACVGACPAGALSDDADHPRLGFTEQACVQCGLCVATCPERVISLEPRFDFTTKVFEPVTMKEEEPFGCISCGKPFGTKSAIERIISKLEGRHAMFQNKSQVDIIRMCDDCRVIAVSDGGGDPLKVGVVPRVRTTEDYIMGTESDDDDDTVG